MNKFGKNLAIGTVSVLSFLGAYKALEIVDNFVRGPEYEITLVYDNSTNGSSCYETVVQDRNGNVLANSLGIPKFASHKLNDLEAKVKISKTDAQLLNKTK